MRILQLTQEVRFLQWKQAQEATDALQRSRALALERYRYYQRVLGWTPDGDAPPEKLAIDRRELHSPRKLMIPPHAGVAELADAQDLKSWAPKGACGFDSRPRHHNSTCKDGPFLDIELSSRQRLSTRRFDLDGRRTCEDGARPYSFVTAGRSP